MEEEEEEEEEDEETSGGGGGGGESKKEKEAKELEDAKFGKYETISITWGERAENHKGMQMIGSKELAPHGLTLQELLAVPGPKEVYRLDELLYPHDDGAERGEQPAGVGKMGAAGERDAYIVIYRGGVDRLLGAGATKRLEAEIKRQRVDKKAWQYGEVRDKGARWNNTYGDFAQEPKYEEKKGTVIDFRTVPELAAMRAAWPRWYGRKTERLVAETNDYHDARTGGIGWHGDSERKIVVCARFGRAMPIGYRWFQRSTPLGRERRVVANGGDIYAMTEKATGFDWKRTSIRALRHAAGADHYFKYNAKQLKKEVSLASGGTLGASQPKKAPGAKAKARPKKEATLKPNPKPKKKKLSPEPAADEPEDGGGGGGGGNKKQKKRRVTHPSGEEDE